MIAIDAGGSSTRARALVNGVESGTGSGGPANALSPHIAVLRASFASALRDLPQGLSIVACVAGARSPNASKRVLDVIHELRPGILAFVFPDFAAAFHALPEGTRVAVIAGTGSVVCSPNVSEAGWLVSGGCGWILGDHGSASALGRAVLEAYVNEFRQWPAWVTNELGALYGDTDPRAIVRTIHSADAPAQLLALAAPLLTRLAAEGDQCAETILDNQFARLAETTVAHAQRLGHEDAIVGLTGGVWNSAAAIRSFRLQLELRSDGLQLGSTAPVDPLDGAVRIALQLERSQA